MMYRRLNIHPKIRFEHEFLEDSVVFLDIRLTKFQDYVSTTHYTPKKQPIIGICTHSATLTLLGSSQPI